jgi:UDP-glucose 4-epimerase
MSPTALTWVIGRGGLLGKSFETAMGAKLGAATSRAALWRPAEPIAWLAPGAGAVDLRTHAVDFLRAAKDRPWSVAWCAGAGVTGTSAHALQLELGALRETLDCLAAASGGSAGAFFFASSAGAVYAGVGSPPYDESSPVRALAPYGRAKLEGEALVRAWSTKTGTPALIGRIANLYGPGQNLEKAQGLISQICRAQLTGQPLSIYVSLDTLRDYFFAPDCAALMIEALERLRRERSAAQPRVVTKIFASQRAITIGAVLGEMRRIFRRTPPIVLGSAAASALQAKDLSLRSRVWPQLDRRALTPLPAGIAATAADMQRRLQAGWPMGVPHG